MTCFSPDVGQLNITAPDPFKRLNYTLGMLLGVDDFRQEQDYHLERVRWLARDLLGYGTVRGLAVVLEKEGAKGWRVHVTKGVAVSPSGQLICVPVDQCSNLNDWLAAQVQDKKTREALENSVIGSPPNELRLFLTLSYQTCLTDNAPIPGEPCRSEAELMQPSRLKDDFRLEFRYGPPPQREEDAVRDFVRWLTAIPLDKNSPPSMNLDTFLAEVRKAALPWLYASPPLTSPPDDFKFDSPPKNLRINREQFRAALRLWVTELEPLWIARYGCGATPPFPQPSDDAVLLANLTLPVLRKGTGWVVSDTAEVEKTEDQRPFVVHLRVLQELFIRSALGLPAPL
jgi:hypothetical protein